MSKIVAYNKHLSLGGNIRISKQSHYEKKSLVSRAINFFFRYDIGEMVLDWLCVKILSFDWLREIFDVTCNFRQIISKKKSLLTPLAN